MSFVPGGFATLIGYEEASLPMRKQYHFRQSAGGLMSWDIDRLVALTKDFPRIQIPLSAIRELDEPFWFGHGDVPTCRAVAEHARLMEAADLRFPIILSSDGRVMDGMHRVGKAVLLRRPTLEAVKFIDDPDADYIGVQPDDLPYDEAPSLGAASPTSSHPITNRP
jgi:hypothetical protein